MRTRLKLNPGQRGAKKLLAQYGDRLVYVRYRYDAKQKKRFKTVELIVEAIASKPPQWEDLWADVCEGLLNRTDHFLGTAVLRQSEEHRTDALGRVVEVFDVVDGQQRLTTLALLVLALFEYLRDQPFGKGMWLDFVEHDGVVRLELGGVNTQYFLSLIDAVRDAGPLPDSPRYESPHAGWPLLFP